MPPRPVPGALLVAVLLGFLAPERADAQDRAPTFDPRPGCRNVATLDPVGGRRESDCLADEEQARGEVARRWREFSAASRTECVQEGRIGGPPSYVELLTCLEIASSATGDGGTPLGAPPAGARPRR